MCLQPRGYTAAVRGMRDCTPGALYCIRRTVLTVTIDDDDRDNQPHGDTAAVRGGDRAPGMLYCIR